MIPDVAEFSLAFSRALGKVIVHIDGALDMNTAPELSDRLVDLIEGQGNHQFVLDVRAMTSIDAVGFALLVDALNRVKENGGEMVLSGPTRGVALALTAAGLDDVFFVTPKWEHPAGGDGRHLRAAP